MKAEPRKLTPEGYRPCSAEEATHVRLRMPGPIPYRCLPVQLGGSRRDTGNWSWNGDVDKPTLKPSILTDNGRVRCHTFVNDGVVQFLVDCTHDLKKTKVPLLDIPLPTVGSWINHGEEDCGLGYLEYDCPVCGESYKDHDELWQKRDDIYGGARVDFNCPGCRQPLLLRWDSAKLSPVVEHRYYAEGAEGDET